MPKTVYRIGNGRLLAGDALALLPDIPANSVQCIVADPPYYKVLDTEWDNDWAGENAYLQFSENWVSACKRVLRDDGLLYIFGQLGKREHVWLHTCSRLANIMQFHDMIIWDRVVGYERKDSFVPRYEMILVLRKEQKSIPYFDKDAVRIPYDRKTRELYLRDKRYKDKKAREAYLLKGKCSGNIMSIPSLKGSSREKRGHPSQKPIALVDRLVRSATREGDLVLDPFVGSGTTAIVAQATGRRWICMEKNPEYIKMTRKAMRECMNGSAQLNLLADAKIGLGNG